METTEDIKAREEKFSDIFRIGKLSVPEFQRPYKWEEDDISDYWNDLTSNESVHFFGQIVINTENNLFEVIDGQQRLTTITILLAAIRDQLFDLGKASEAQKIQHAGIESSDIVTSGYYFSASPTLGRFFINYIQLFPKNENLIEASNDEESRVKTNYLWFRDVVKEYVSGIEENEAKSLELISLARKILASLAILVKIKTEDGAYDVFEVLNDRGTDLTTAELLKNLLFKKIKQEEGDTSKIVDAWDEISQKITETDFDLAKFIRYSWMSRHGFVQDKELYRTIKKDWNKPYLELLKDLQHDANLFSILKGGASDFDWDDLDKGKEILSSLEALRLLDISQCFVFLMALLRNKDLIPRNGYQVYSAIEKFNFTYHTVAKLPANKVEKKYAEYAEKLETIIKTEPNEVNTQQICDLLIQFLRQLQPTLVVFDEKFPLAVTYNKKRGLMRYVLNKIELENPNHTGETRLWDSNVNIEHVLPKKPGQGWDIPAKEAKAVENLIGNLTLLHKKKNSSIGNSSLQDKFEALKKFGSQILMVQELLEYIEANNMQWGPDQINNRTKLFADRAYAVWKI